MSSKSVVSGVGFHRPDELLEDELAVGGGGGYTCAVPALCAVKVGCPVEVVCPESSGELFLSYAQRGWNLLHMGYWRSRSSEGGAVHDSRLPLNCERAPGAISDSDGQMEAQENKHAILISCTTRQGTSRALKLPVCLAALPGGTERSCHLLSATAQTIGKPAATPRPALKGICLMSAASWNL